MNKQTLAYLQQDLIGKVIAKGLAAVYTQKPNKPIKYLAHWFKNYSDNQKELKRLEANAKKAETSLKIYQSNRALEVEQQKLKQIEQKKNQEYVNKFKNQIATHQYQEELLHQDVCQFLEHLFGFTGVYIGELNHPKRTLSEEDTEENAHLDLTVPKLINYIGSSKSHKDLMLGKTLTLQKGVTAKAFELSLEDPPQRIGQDGNPIPQEKKQKCIYIQNVVKNQNMHYFRLPKLGAYVAVPLIYSSFLKESIFDTALAAKKKENLDREQFEKAKKEALQSIEKETEQISHRLHELIDKNADESQLEPIKEELAKAEEKYKQKQAENFNVESFELPTQKHEYVICADNLGSDKEISEQQRHFLVDFALHFKNSWEKKEHQLLEKDVETQINYEQKFLDVPVEEIMTAIEVELQLDEQIQEKTTAIEDEELKNYRIEGWKIQKLKKYILANQKFEKSFEILKNFRIIKFKELIQNILYFQGKVKSQINQRGNFSVSLGKATIDWKNVKRNFINKDLFNNVLSYVIEESKSGQYPPYAKINSIIEKRKFDVTSVQSMNDSQIFHYNIGLAVLKKYIQRALKHRINNIKLRKVQRENQKKKREQIIAENQKINQEKIKALENHKAALPAEEVQTFSEDQWSTNYDIEHPLLEVPPEVVQDIDNDY